jgi:stage V sporulation protein R
MKGPHRDPNVDESTIEELNEAADELNKLAEDLGLSPNDVNYWLVDHDEINQLAAYDGFQSRYPHWRWGMKYVERKKKDTYFGGKIFELVNHDEPSHAFLQESNTIQDQKSVIAHVEAHADFFANNNFFPDDPNAASMLERHAKIIESYYEDPSIEYEDVEEWIDSILCLENTIDQLTPIEDVSSQINGNEEDSGPSVKEQVESLDISDDVKRQVFGDIEDEEDDMYGDEDSDVLAFLLKHGKQYREEENRADEYEDWQRTILEILRREAYYFAAQKMTKIMNEGWAAFWESVMMTNEGYAEPDEIIDYADKQSKVLNAPGLNPYKIGKELWEYIENQTNRREVAEKLLRVEGITWRNFHNKLDFTEIMETIDDNVDTSDPCQRHYSLIRRQNLGFLENISKDDLQRITRYMFEKDKYNTIEEALEDINYAEGWEKMREIRETHNDITFIDAFLTEEFIDSEEYFAYEFNPSNDQYEVSGVDLDSVKRKLLLQITNGGKPTITAADGNYNNSGELLLKHQYNGIPLDIDQSTEVLKRLFNLWGRPVNLKTIDKDAEGNEQGLIIRYDGEGIEETETSEVDDIRADQIDYDTKPDEWT